MIGDLAGFNLSYRHVADMPVEVDFLFEQILHGIHRRAQENEVAESALVGAHDFFEDFHELLPAVEEGDVLELFEYYVNLAASDGGETPGEAEDGADVVFVHAPVQRQDAVAGGVLRMVEYEVGVRKTTLDYALVLVRRGGLGANDGGAQGEQEFFRAANLQHRDLCRAEIPAGDAHVEEGLLHQRLLAGLGRFVNRYVLALFEQVGNHRLLAAAAYVALASDRLVINERGIHSVTTLFSRQK